MADGLSGRLCHCFLESAGAISLTEGVLPHGASFWHNGQWSLSIGDYALVSRDNSLTKLGGKGSRQVMHKTLSILVVIIATMVSVSAQSRHDRIRFADDKGAGWKLEPSATETEAFFPGTAYSYSVEDFKPGVVQVGPRTTYLKEGLRTDEVVRLLGKPASISEQSDNGVTTTTYRFYRGEGRILIAEFVSGVLVRSRLENQVEKPAQADR